MAIFTVIDIFCGAGGFSEGFRQQGFNIVMGIDHWEPAIMTYNHNYGLQCNVKNVLDFESSIEEIEKLPDTDVIIGSPPCVTFSSSNISGKADKSMGIKLTLIFLRIVAVKRWKPNSKLKAWYMENVPGPLKHLGQEYTFEELNLGDWATQHRMGRNKVAIRLEGNQTVINSADYGSPQSRKRAISGQIVRHNRLILPPKTHAALDQQASHLPVWRALRDVVGQLPPPNSTREHLVDIIDPNYPHLILAGNRLSDHFYDNGLFECEWRQSRFYKQNHPYMGRMSFPENPDSPSRTITATKIGTSREAIIYRSERNRKGDGEYRTPTVREAACLMGFPLTYQFLGGETTKWRLVGNAVCPSVSRAFAKQLREFMRLTPFQQPIVQQGVELPENNLNTFQEKLFVTPPRRTSGSRFRRHPFKYGNLTITLSNYDIIKNEKRATHWQTSIQYGNGEGFPSYNVPLGTYQKIEPYLKKQNTGEQFLHQIQTLILPALATGEELQEMYEEQRSHLPLLEPTLLVEEVARIIDELAIQNQEFVQKKDIFFENKEHIPLTQLYALYVMNKIATLANR